MRQVLTRILHAIANTADNLSSKLATNEPDPLLDYEKRGYEPAGIVHYGEYHIMLGNNHYSAYNQPDGSTDVYVNDEHLGNYPKDSYLWPIIEHAKDQKRP